MIRQISKNCFAIGKTIDRPNIKISFVSYLICGKLNVLIDTVPEKSVAMWEEELLELLSGKGLDAIILNHSEEDHSGGIGILLNRFPGIPVYCTNPCKERIKEKYPDANCICVGDEMSVCIGDIDFKFIHTPGLHWDDNMVTFYQGERILFSNDLFGQYVACDDLSDGRVSEQELMTGTSAYFEKVFFSAEESEKKVISKVISLKPQLIAVGHGVVLKHKLQQVLDFYKEKCL